MAKKSKKKVSKKKASTKKTSKKTSSKKTAKKAKKAKAKGPKPMSKSDLIAGLMERHELSRKQVSAILDDIAATAESQLVGRGAPGKFTLPGLARFVAKKRPAKKARKGISPFTGEEIMFKAKPATTVAKIYPVKALKLAVAGGK